MTTPDVEQAIIGCVLAEPDKISVCHEAGVCPEWFHDLRCRGIFQTILALDSDSKPVDMLTVYSRMKLRGTTERCGGFDFLQRTPEAYVSSAHLPEYIAVLKDHHLRREIEARCVEFKDRLGGGETAAEILMELEASAMAFHDGGGMDSESASAVVKEAVQELERIHGKRGEIMGLSTGFNDLDRKTDGLHPGDMIIVAAETSVGKTALACGIAVRCALAGVSVCIFSLEMPAKQLMVRALCSEARVNVMDIRDGLIQEREFARLTQASHLLSKSPLTIVNANGATIDKLTASFRRLNKTAKFQLVVVDYLQLVSCPSKDSREQEVSAVSKGIKALAMEHGVPVLALSQLNDEGRLRESRAIGQDADGVWKLEREDKDQGDVQRIRLMVEKNRNGPTGPVALTFRRCFTRFESAAKVTDDDVPPPYTDT